MNKKLKIFLAVFILFLVVPVLGWTAPFLVCDPYIPIGDESITNVEVKYIVGGVTYSATGTYTVSGDYIILYDLDDLEDSSITGYIARWSTDGGTTWSVWGGVRFRLKRPK